MIFVTGGTGFLGSYLLSDLIKAGKKVRALRRENNPLIPTELSGDSAPILPKDTQDKIEWIEGDVLDVFSLMEAMKGVEQVYHCAGIVSFAPGMRKVMNKVNIEGTANVVNIALESGIKKLVHVSSINAIGRTPKKEMITETTKWENDKLNTNYAISKFLSERELWRAMAEGLKAVIVNPSVILGAGNWNQGTAKLFTHVWNGLKYYPVGKNGFVDVRDVAKAMIGLMESDIQNERFIISSQNLTYQQVLCTIADCLNKKRPSIKVTPLLSNFAWRAAAIKSWLTRSDPFITKEEAMMSSNHFEYNNKKIRDAINIHFTPLQTTIKQTAKKFKLD